MRDFRNKFSYRPLFFNGLSKFVSDCFLFVSCLEIFTEFQLLELLVVLFEFLFLLNITQSFNQVICYFAFNSGTALHDWLECTLKYSQTLYSTIHETILLPCVIDEPNTSVDIRVHLVSNFIQILLNVFSQHL